MYFTELTKFEDELCLGIKKTLESMTPLKVIKGWVNGAARPKEPYIMYAIQDITKLSTNSSTYDKTQGTQLVRTANKVRVQLDIYAPNALDVGRFLQIAVLSPEAAAIFNTHGFSILYTEDLINNSFLNESKRFEQRGTLWFWVQFVQEVKQEAVFPTPRIHYKQF